MSSVIVVAIAVVVTVVIATYRFLEWCLFCCYVLAEAPVGVVASVVVDVKVVVYALFVVLLDGVDAVAAAVVAAVAAHARRRLLSFQSRFVRVP